MRGCCVCSCQRHMMHNSPQNRAGKKEQEGTRDKGQARHQMIALMFSFSVLVSSPIISLCVHLLLTPCFLSRRKRALLWSGFWIKAPFYLRAMPVFRYAPEHRTTRGFATWELTSPTISHTSSLLASVVHTARCPPTPHTPQTPP